MVRKGDIFKGRPPHNDEKFSFIITYVDDKVVRGNWIGVYNNSEFTCEFNKGWEDGINTMYHRAPNSEEQVLRLLNKVDEQQGH